MIDGLKPYPEYKDSGQPWLGKIPKHWEVMRNGRLFVQRNETGYSELPILEVSLKTGVRVRNFDESKRKQVMTDRAKYKRAKQGDIAYNMMRMWQGAVGRVPVDGLVSPAYVVARPLEGCNTLYFSYLFRTAAYRQEVNNSSRGIVSDRNRLYWVDFKQLPSVLPPPDEQAAIVRFLGYANRRFDLAIRANRKLIVLLNEQKQAIIQQAVSRGLDPSVPMKPSGIHWIGDIPEHWDSLRSKYVFHEVDERSQTGEETHLSMSQKLGLVPSSLIEERRLMSESYISAKVCQKDDLVLNRLKAHLGVFALASELGLVSPDYTVFRPIRAIQPRYFELLYRTQACRLELRKRAKGIVEGFWRLYTDDFYDIRVPVPPLEEQMEILEELEVQLKMPNAAIDNIGRDIDLQHEYRTRLIADVVTGQLDVREAAHHLSDDADEPTTMEADYDDVELELELDEIAEEAET